MKRFKNILVGVDLSEGDRYVSENLAAPTTEAIRRALWLAKTNSANVLFLFTLDSSTIQMSARQDNLLEEHEGGGTVVDHAQNVLSNLVEDARQKGVDAESQVTFGKSWLALVRRVLEGQHDLVVVGTRKLGPLKSMILGSTGIKLLRKCPCPVWVAKPQAEQKISSILVATDLSPVGELALELGSSLAELQHADLHVLHSPRYPAEADLLPESLSSKDGSEYERDLEEYIAAQVADAEFSRKPQLHLADEAPDLAILDHIKRENIQLLVMGTVSRGGIVGMITGNTAERLLPHIPCSVLAVKPANFQSPVTLE